MATADASSDVRVVIATWNCACAAPAKPKNPGDRRKLSKTLTRLRSEGCVPDALALQETKFSSNKQTGEMEHLHFAMSDTEHKYTWLHPIGKRLPVQENMAQQHTGRKTDLEEPLIVRCNRPARVKAEIDALIAVQLGVARSIAFLSAIRRSSWAPCTASSSSSC